MCLDDGEPTTPCTAGSTLTWTGGYFHGPRAHQHLVLLRLLTGAGGGAGLPFKIRSQDAFGATVLAEGTDATGALYWVHAWTVGATVCYASPPHHSKGATAM
nr:unnamed protein product [Digitaria exilis]